MGYASLKLNRLDKPANDKRVRSRQPCCTLKA
jgi:hypothetical protein